MRSLRRGRVSKWVDLARWMRAVVAKAQEETCRMQCNVPMEGGVARTSLGKSFLHWCGWGWVEGGWRVGYGEKMQTKRHTDLVLDKPAGQLLRRPVSFPLKTSDEDSVVDCLPVERPVHGLLLARVVALQGGGCRAR